MSATAIEFHAPPSIAVGGDSSQRLPEVAAAIGISRPLIVCDPYMAEHGPVPRFAELLAAAGAEVALYGGVQPDPSAENVRAASAAFHDHGADGVIAIGGGSSLDAGKAAAVMSGNEGDIVEYAGYHRLPRPGSPLIGVPTTAGTGSEVTRVAVITDSARATKLMILDDHLLCSAALVDHRLTVTCPADLTAFVGVDALTHAIEAYVSRRATALTGTLALRAMALIAPNLTRVHRDPEDDAAREALALGATLAGLAFSNASVALVHGMSRPLGAHFHLAHGHSNAVLLPDVTAYSLPGAPRRYAQVSRKIGAAGAADTDEVACARLVEHLRGLNEEMGIASLAQHGVDRDAYVEAAPAMAAAALASGSPANNPRVPSAEEIVEIYAAAFA